MADETQPIDVPEPAKRKGWPKGKPRGLRTAPQQQARDPDIQHNEHGKVSVRGRDGEWLSRKRPANQDEFFIPPHMIPAGFEYQWNVVTVHGMEMISEQIAMAENGWRPVPADRPDFAGRFMPVGATGAIVRGGQRLEERPKALCDQARAEDQRNARQQMSDRNESLKLSGVTKGTGFEMNANRYRGTGGNITMNIDRGLMADESGNIIEAPRPSHQLAEPGE